MFDFFTPLDTIFEPFFLSSNDNDKKLSIENFIVKRFTDTRDSVQIPTYIHITFVIK
jgi:hypothetical protein